MPRPLKDRVTEEACPAALVIGFLVGRSPFQDAMAEPGKQPLSQSGRRTRCDAEESTAEAGDDRLRQFDLPGRVEGHDRIHGPNGEFYHVRPQPKVHPRTLPPFGRRAVCFQHWTLHVPSRPAKARFRARQSEFRRKPSCMTRLLSSWSRQDATNVYLPSAKVSIVRAALDAAAKNVGSRAETKLKQRTGLACLVIAFSRLRTFFDLQP